MRRASESRLRPLKNEPSEGAETASTIIKSVITRISSIKVKPCWVERGDSCPQIQSNSAEYLRTGMPELGSTGRSKLLLLRRLPVTNIIFASSAAIRAHGHQIIGSGVVLPGTFVNIGVAPGIIWNIALHVGSLPTGSVAGLL